MIAASAEIQGAAQLGARLDGRIDAHGSLAQAYFASPDLLRGADAARNLADAVYFLCTLHGRYPGVIDLAADRTSDPLARDWLNRSAAAFAVERRYLATLAVAVGPVPGTPGGSASEAAVIAQRAALATLAGSERNGCALGAAIGLVADWISIRSVLETAARRLGVEPPACTLPDRGEIRVFADSLAGNFSFERALLFGAEQLLTQHHGLWALLEARQQARRGI
jgi:hypothetical protein